MQYKSNWPLCFEDLVISEYKRNNHVEDYRKWNGNMNEVMMCRQYKTVKIWYYMNRVYKIRYYGMQKINNRWHDDESDDDNRHSVRYGIIKEKGWR